MRLSREIRRSIIISAARRIIRKHGVHAVTWWRVAQACHVPTSGACVRYHFKTNAEIIHAAQKRPADRGVSQRV